MKDIFWDMTVYMLFEVDILTSVWGDSMTSVMNTFRTP